MSENHFENEERNITDTDVALAKAYFPMLKEQKLTGETITFGDFVAEAKKRYPNDESVQNAIPVSTGRRLEFIRLYTKRYDLPDLSAWEVGAGGENSEAYSADFNPQEERDASLSVDYSEYEGEWGEYIVELAKRTIKLKRRKEADAVKIMSDYATPLKAKINSEIPNPKKLDYVILVKPFRDPIIEGLMEGKDVEDVFNDVIFDMTKSRSAVAI